MNKSNAAALYIHIPFCEHLCDYCDFPKLQYFTIFAKPYIKRLISEIESYQIKEQLKTIYIGGGTPICLEDDLFEELLSYLDKYQSGVIEYTIECNPESLSENKLQIMKRHGVNRLSIGIESTNDEILKAINRHHTFLDAKKAILNAKRYGFDNLNADIILGLPNANIEQIRKDLEVLLTLDVQHLSFYSLSVNPHTLFFLNNVQEPNSDISRNYYDLVNETLENNGYIHYEVSNWSKPHFQSRHNLVYWQNEHYYGVGLGAAGYLGNVRYTNTKSITEYLKGHYLDSQEEVTISDDIEYQIMLNLRTNQGINLTHFKSKFGFDLLNSKQDTIEELINEGYLLLNNNHLIPTYEGMMTLDQIILKLI